MFWPRCEQAFDVVLFVLPPESSTWFPWPIPALCNSGGGFAQCPPALKVRTPNREAVSVVTLDYWVRRCRSAQSLVLPALLCWAVTFKTISAELVCVATAGTASEGQGLHKHGPMHEIY